MHYPVDTNCCLYQGQDYPEDHRQAPIGVHLKVSSCKYVKILKSSYWRVVVAVEIGDCQDMWRQGSIVTYDFLCSHS